MTSMNSTTMPTTKSTAATRVQVDSKALYAKLLAAENLSVEHDPKAPTAYFDTQKRRLVLPKWENMSDDLYNMLVAHEVAHALFTPSGKGWVDDVTAIDPKNSGIVKGYFNVVEDARIERLMKVRYPGIRRSFLNGYNELLQSDKFKISGKDIAELGLIDRINLHYKIGVFLNVPFSAEEMPLVSEVATTKTYEDALDLTRRIYEFVKEQKEKEQEESEDGQGEDTEDTQESDQSESSDGGQEGNNSTEGQEEAQNQPTGDSGEGEGNSSSNGQEGEEKDSKKSQSGKKGTTNPDSSAVPDMSLTDDILQEAAKEYVNQHGTRTSYGDLPDFDLSAIETPADIIKLMDGFNPNWQEAAEKLYQQFVRNNQNAINMLYREFMQRRAADEQRRTRTADTGSIDANRLWAYRISEEVFATYQSVRDGQNHGLIFYVDWSGSMSGIIGRVAEQTLCLAEFCRKANIPFEVYAFTDRPSAKDRQLSGSNGVHDQVYQNPWKFRGSNPMMGVNFRLLNFLSSRCKGVEYRKSASLFLFLATHNTYSGPDSLRLNGTPLNAAVVSAMTLVPQFKAANRLQIVHTIFLTDGGAGDTFSFKEYGDNAYGNQTVFRRDGYCSIPCMGYSTDSNRSLLQLLKTVCPGTNTIGFDILGARTIADRVAKVHSKTSSEVFKMVKEEGFGTIDNYYGYSRWFGLTVNAEDTTDHWESLRVNGKKVTSSVFSKTLTRELSKAKGNRQFLARFAEIIAKEAK